MSDNEISIHRNLTGNPPVIIASYSSVRRGEDLDFIFKSKPDSFSMAWPTRFPLAQAIIEGLEAVESHNITTGRDSEQPVKVVGKSPIFTNSPIEPQLFKRTLKHYQEGLDRIEVELGSATIGWSQSEHSPDSMVAGDMIYEDQYYSRKLAESLFARTLPEKLLPGLSRILDEAGAVLDLHLAPAKS